MAKKITTKGGISTRQNGKFPRYVDNETKRYNPAEQKGAGPSLRQKGNFPRFIDGDKPARFNPE